MATPRNAIPMKIVLGRQSYAANVAALTAAAPDAEWVLIETDGSVDGDLAGTNIFFWGADMYGNDPRFPRVREICDEPELQWIQGPSAGLDNKLWQGLLDRGVRLTNASGIWAEPMAQYITAWILAWSQHLGGQMLRSQHHEWSPVQSDDLTARTLGIVGYGGIGKATARIAHAIGMRVIATRRTPGEEENVDELLPPDRLPELLGAADYVVVTVPLSDATFDLIGADEFAMMGDHTVFINVARGEVIDENALADALRQGVIRGATTDVTRQEPLPADSPLWDLPNLVITPHQSGDGPRSQERLDAMFVENLRRYTGGADLINEVTTTGITR